MFRYLILLIVFVSVTGVFAQEKSEILENKIVQLEKQVNQLKREYNRVLGIAQQSEKWELAFRRADDRYTKLGQYLERVSKELQFVLSDSLVNGNVDKLLAKLPDNSISRMLVDSKKKNESSN